MYPSNFAARVMLVLIPALITAGAWAQVGSVVIEGKDTRNPLGRHHIANTKRALIAALRNDDAEVRQAASGALANGWPKDAIAPIKEAMLREIVAGNREAMAFDLARLGDATGRDTLTRLCHSTADPEYVRMAAAMNMSFLKDDSCVDVVLDVFRLDSDPDDPDSKSQALSLVPGFIGRLGGEESRRVLELVAKALDDPDPGVRMTASNTLGLLGDVSAIPALQAALTREKNEGCRLQMFTDLQRLEKLKQSQ